MLVVVSLCGSPAALAAQSSAPDSMLAEAVALQARPDRYAEAARLYIRSAAVRQPQDTLAVPSFMMGAHLLGYVGRTLEAREVMEHAGDHALALGDLVTAAEAFILAAFFAEEAGQAREAQRLGWRAWLLTRSTLLGPGERGDILRRLGSVPALTFLRENP